jgi:cellulose synthase/poly-beta-1,6-N-acetylglucosamine synthase-like glycosyltransferase
LARQDFDEPAEFLFVVSEKMGSGPVSTARAKRVPSAGMETDPISRTDAGCASDGALPAGLADELPGLKVVLAPVHTSYELKNAGVRAAAGDLVVFLDADCVPEPGWLRALVATMRGNPDAVATSGRTVYEGRGLIVRSLSGSLARLP